MYIYVSIFIYMFVGILYMLKYVEQFNTVLFWLHQTHQANYFWYSKVDILFLSCVRKSETDLKTSL